MEFSKYNNKINENEFISSFTSEVNDTLSDLLDGDYDTEDEYYEPSAYLSASSLKDYLQRFRPSKRHLANSKLFRGETVVSLTLDEDSGLGLQNMAEMMIAENPNSPTRPLIEWLLTRGYSQSALNLPINLTMQDLLDQQFDGYTGSWEDFLKALEVLEVVTRPSDDVYCDLPRQLFYNVYDHKDISVRRIDDSLCNGFHRMSNILLDIDSQERSMEELLSRFDEHKWTIGLQDIKIPCNDVSYNPFFLHKSYIINLDTETLTIHKDEDILPAQEVSQEQLCETLSLGILYSLANLMVQKNFIGFVLPNIEAHITDEDEVYKRIEKFSTGLNEDLDRVYNLVSDDVIGTEDFVIKIFNEMVDYYRSTLVVLYAMNLQNHRDSNQLLWRYWENEINSDRAVKFALNPFGEVSYQHHKQDESEIDSRVLKQFNQLPKFGKQLKFIIRKCKEQWKKLTPRSFAYQKGFNTFSFYRVINKYPNLKQPLDEMVLTNKDMYGYLDTPLTNYLADKIYGDCVETFKSQFTETFWNDLYARIAPELNYKTEVGSEPVTLSLEQKDILTASFSGYSWTSCHAGSYLQSPFALAANDVTFVAYGSGGRDANHLNGTVDKKRYRTYCHYAEVGDDFLLSVEGIYPFKSSGLKQSIYKALCERIGVKFDDLVRVEFPVFGQPGYEILESTILSGYYDYYENNVSTYMTKNLYNQLKSKAMELLEDVAPSQALDDFYNEILLASDNDPSSDLAMLVRDLNKQEIYEGIQLIFLQNELSRLLDGCDHLPVVNYDDEYSLQKYWNIVTETLRWRGRLEDSIIAYYLYTQNLSDLGSPVELSITKHAMSAHDLLELTNDYYNDDLFAYDFYPNPWGESYRVLYAIE